MFELAERDRFAGAGRSALLAVLTAELEYTGDAADLLLRRMERNAVAGLAGQHPHDRHFAAVRGVQSLEHIGNGIATARSDAEAFTTLGTVVDGMSVLESLYSGYGENSGGGMRQGKQPPLIEGGNAYIDREYPLLDRIIRVTVTTVH